MPPDELADLVARAAGAASSGSDEPRGASKALAALIPALARRAKKSGIRAVAAGRWFVELVLEVAPRLPVRDAATLREQYPTATDIEIAERLVKSAAKTTAALGAAAGGLSAVEFLSPPTMLAAPVQLAAEMLTVTAVELKLVAELHEILGYPAQGSASERAGLYVMSWSRRRAVGEASGSAGLGAILGASAKRELRSQLLRRLGRSTTTLAPFLAGAVAGAEVNRRATKQLGETLLAELRGRAEDRWFRRV
jgi:hypothetical protein